MPIPTRRGFISTALSATASVAALGSPTAFASALPGQRKFTLDLSPGAIGVRASQLESIEFASKHGFESVLANPGYLATLDDAGRKALREKMEVSNVVWGAAGLPVDFRKGEDVFKAGLKTFPQQCKAMQQAGVTRVSTWLRPNSDSLTYVANFRQHARRLRECVKIMADHGQRFGMEYVGPKTLWASARYSFIHSMAETKELIAEIGMTNVGLVLDSWHWYTAGETVEDLKTLSNSDIVACDLNDAPANIPVDEQIDNKRLLPATSGVIDLKAFLGALVEIGYDGPVRAEPFNAELNALDNDPACAATVKAMKKAFSMVGG